MIESGPAPGGPPLLRIRDATVRRGARGDRTILHRLSLEIPLGQHTAILGPNGSGKSTLLRLITRDLYPVAREGNEPAVQIFGRTRWDVFELRHLLGIVTPALDRELTEQEIGLRGIDTVLSGFFATRGVQPFQQIEAAMLERAHRVLDLMDAGHLAGKPMHEMSTGEARRVLIARALAPEPPALLLDEPTAGLDIVAMRRFLETVQRLARTGTTILLVTHHLHEIIPEIDRVVLLQEGRIARDGAKRQVLTPESLSETYGVPLDVTVDRAGYFSVDLAQDRVPAGA